VLSGVSAGVIALDTEEKVSLFNRSATNLLSIKESPRGEDFENVFPEAKRLLDKAKESAENVVQDEITITRKKRKATLLVRVVKEEFSDEIEGYIVTFDDITELLTAQRTAAWSDVARRIAHEVKNPLTPINLSAERLRKKYRDEIKTEPEVFDKYIDTIGKHVANIENIIEEFAQFARMPSPVMRKEDICEIIRDAIFTQKTVNSNIEYEVNIPDHKIISNMDKNQMSQVMINLLKNSIEALVENDKDKDGKIKVSVSEGDNIKIDIEDNGPGFPDELLDRITEPYVTTREKGTGLGLAIVKKIIGDHDGTLFVDNILDNDGKILGAKVELALPLSTTENKS